MSIPNDDQNKQSKLSFLSIDKSDTLSNFVDKCNINFNTIAEWSGIPNGKQGDPGATGSPTKPKVPIHVWKMGEEYKNESENKTEGFIISGWELKIRDKKYQEGHLILLENGHVYILTTTGEFLTPKYLLTLQFDINEKNLNDIVQTKIGDIENKAKEVTTNIENKVNEINTLQSGSLNLLDRTEFKKYNPIDNEDKIEETYFITDKTNLFTRNFSLMPRDLIGSSLEINDKSKHDNNLLTNSLILNTYNSTKNSNINGENCSDVMQTLNVVENNVTYTILKPNTKYTLQCKYKCNIKTEFNTDDVGGYLFITYSNPSWINVNGNEANTNRNDLKTPLYINNDWTPLIIKFKTGENVGKTPNEEINGCGFYIRSKQGSIIEICELKLEEGDIHTSWSPSLADITSTKKSSNIYIDGTNNTNYKNYIINNKLYIKTCDYNTISTLVLIQSGEISEIQLPPVNKIDIGYVVKIKYLPNRNYSVDSTDARIIGINNRSANGGSITIENSYSEFTYFGGNTWCQTK